MHSNILNKVSLLSIFFVIILLPIFALPFTSFSVETSKGLFLVIGLIVSVIVWTMARFADGHITVPRSIPLVAGAGVVVAYLLSAIFSDASSISFFGTMLDVGSFWYILAVYLLFLLSAIVFRDSKSARLLLFGILLTGTIILAFQALRIFLPTQLSLGVLGDKTGNLIGSWNAFGIFAGMYVLAALFIIEFLKVPKQLKILLGVLSFFAMALMAIVNFPLIWAIFGVFALLIFVYKVSLNTNKRKEGEKIHFPVFAFVVVLLSLFFFMSSNFIGQILPGKLGISNTEVSPSLKSTATVAKNIIRHDPVFGIGPNRFSEGWARYKPAVINATPFWDVYFVGGSGLIPTFMATTGIVGILFWLLFFVTFIAAGIKSVFTGFKHAGGVEAAIFFFLAFYLFVASFFYFVGSVLFILAFAFAGISIGLMAESREKGFLSVSFFDDHRKTFFFMVFLICVMIASAAAGFKYVERFVSISYFSKAISAKTIPDAETYIRKALALHSSDVYLRTYSQIYLTKLNSLAVKANSSSSVSEADKAALQTAFNEATVGAQAAVLYNPKNYLNNETLGVVYQTAGLIGVKGAYDEAIKAYTQASLLNPENPRFHVLVSNMYIASDKDKDAKVHATKALALKPDYVDALLTLSQIAKSEGNTTEAISYAERALSILPTNQDLVKYVNALKNGSTPTPPPTTATTPTPTTATPNTSSKP